MYKIFKNGAIAPAWINFDSKVRRTSFEKEDLFLAYITWTDTFAKGLKVAHNLSFYHECLEKFMIERYSSFSEGIDRYIVTQYILGYN